MSRAAVAVIAAVIAVVIVATCALGACGRRATQGETATTAALPARSGATAPATEPVSPPGSQPVAADRVLVPAGTFVMGDDHGEADERPAHPVYVSAFYLDRTEVTNVAYARCVAAGACHAAERVAGEDGPAQPVVGVTWQDASDYCRFAGGRLPTEAEWEKAARGTDRRIYPWGDALDCARGNFGSWQGDGYCAASGVPPGHTVDVGRFPSGASPYGILDLAGNVWEWVADWYDANQYRREADLAARDPIGPSRPDGDGGRVLRGGGCCSTFVLPRAANRLRFPPSYRDADIGFRCAASVAPGENVEK